MGGIAACCCVALVFAIKHLYNSVFLFVSVHSLSKKEKSVAIDKSD